jgi:hypothetical protein
MADGPQNETGPEIRSSPAPLFAATDQGAGWLRPVLGTTSEGVTEAFTNLDGRAARR